ncbi:(2Fe-2S) ferredoxin domain-containing protein [Phormidium sp. CLA17]|uniref:(2Fe-2S) ferredoxin domain-containing protein n=1 Tax=Leptolyngbya sp. Cla-17 TaxID=2803751 RepID=UPI0014925E3C|nr:(2Fe-2S) ferredoxin domain-containing protein [Leptolyngbya sp. Cla-17]MBM0743469.1 (2Fe-2S) ferredoxin domain-containing protein [Leptolyngbya sp. Cla-17]
MTQVFVCLHINCIRNGSESVLRAFQENPVVDVEVIASVCQGQCNMGATVRVLPDNIWYCRVKPEDAIEIVQQHLKDGEPVARLLHPRIHPRWN